MSKVLKFSRSIYNYSLSVAGGYLAPCNCLSASISTSPRHSQQVRDKSKPKKAPTSLAFNEGPIGDKNEEETSSKNRAQNISRAMIYYLKKMSERDALMKFKTEEFEIGKRHLAHMMGQDPENFTQKDIDEAIRYLLPSGLFLKSARPFFKPPQDYYPKSKVILFANDGRPLHTFFYTGCQEFYQLLYDITEKLINLNKLEDTMNLVKNKMKTFIKEDERLEQFSKMDQTGSEWITYEDFCKKLNIKVDELDYKKAIILLRKLEDHPLSKREEEFIKQFKVPFTPPIKLSEIPQCLIDEEGRKYLEFTCKRHTTHLKVRLYEGTGQVKIRINDDEKGGQQEYDITYFQVMTHREQLLFPFKVIDLINKFDMHVDVYNEGGLSGMAKAIRYCTSRALCAFISTDAIEKLRLAGLLALDNRAKERKKPGQKGARRKYTWFVGKIVYQFKNSTFGP